jgi:hypothetical protein
MVEGGGCGGIDMSARYDKYIRWFADTSDDIKLKIGPFFVWHLKNGVVVLELLRILVDPRGRKDGALLTCDEQAALAFEPAAAPTSHAEDTMKGRF